MFLVLKNKGFNRRQTDHILWSFLTEEIKYYCLDGATVSSMNEIGICMSSANTRETQFTTVICHCNGAGEYVLP